DAELAAVRLDDRVADEQAEARTALAPARGRPVRLEQVRDVLGWDPRAGVEDLEQQRSPGDAAADRDRVAGSAELDRVAEQVAENLHHPVAVAAKVDAGEVRAVDER